MAPAIHNLYIDFFSGRDLRNDLEGLDTNGNREIGIASRLTYPGISMIYVLRHGYGRYC